MTIDELFNAPPSQVRILRAYSSPMMGDSAYFVVRGAAGEERRMEVSNQFCTPPAK